MQPPGMFTILEYSEPFYNCIQTHIQNPVIFTKKGKPFVTLEIQNPWHIDSPGILGTLSYFKLDLYSQPGQRFKMEYFMKIVKHYLFFQSAPP